MVKERETLAALSKDLDGRDMSMVGEEELPTGQPERLSTFSFIREMHIT